MHAIIWLNIVVHLLLRLRSNTLRRMCDPQFGYVIQLVARLRPHPINAAMQRLTQGAQAELARSYGVSQSTISRLAAPGPFEASAVGA
jgi:hypothetical protein